MKKCNFNKKNFVLLTLFSFFSLFKLGPIAFAYETDQFTLPSYSLVDIKSDVAQMVKEGVLKGVAQFHQLKKSEQNQKRLAKEVFKGIGGGVLLTEKMEGLLGEGPFAKPLIKNRYPHEFVAFRPKQEESIYAGATWHRGFGVAYKILFSSTIHLNGVLLGTDKLGHFFKQGHQYYEIYLDSLEQLGHQMAQKKAAYERGVATENSYFGLGLSGVYSNADLFTNYTGMKFYQNLTTAIKINGVVYPPLLVQSESKQWHWNDVFENTSERFLERFIHWQMNEAFNPSLHDFLMAPVVKKNIKEKVCAKWQEYEPELTMESDALRVQKAALWFGEDYGHSTKSSPEKVITTLGNTCFAI